MRKLAQTFEMSVPAFQPAGAAAGPSGGQVQPGESRLMEQHQPEGPLNVWTCILKGLGFGTGALVLSSTLMLADVSWKVPVAVFGVATGLSTMIFIVKPSTILLWFEDLTGADFNGDGQVGTVDYAVNGKLDDGQGHSAYLHFKLESPNGARKWHEFCKAVLYGRKNFSQTEACRRHGLSPRDWESIYTAFVSQHWAIPAGPRGTPRLRGRGWEWVKLYADHPPAPDGEPLSFAGRG